MKSFITRSAVALFALAAVLLMTSGRTSAQAPVPVGGTISAENACYFRLPDLPAARYGGFGGYNKDTGVLTYAGGAQKLSSENTKAFHDLWTIKLDGTMSSWANIPYGGTDGYTREDDKGCREMASVQAAPSLWVSVLGTDGCDNGMIDSTDKRGGDVRMLNIGDTADRRGVKWLSDRLNVGSVPRELATEAGKLVRLFATVDTQRGRAIFGQGTFDNDKDTRTQDEVYSAVRVGTKWNVRELRPTGDIPSRRYSSCAVYIHDEDTGVDGVFVLGGQQGGEASPSSYKEVWWLDFSTRADGVWTDITSRFANMDGFGYRRGGACGFDADTKTFYSWMGRADASVPEGAEVSGGAWQVDLTNLGDEAASLNWERLAADNLDGIDGRRLIPNVWDAANKRLFVMGGRNGLAEYDDVWAIYPGVTGAECAALDPYEPFRPVVPPTPVPPTPGPGPGPGSDMPEACDVITNRVPPVVITDALANPDRISGWGELQSPGILPGPFNKMRTHLSLRSTGVAWHPMFNGLVYKAGCP